MAYPTKICPECSAVARVSTVLARPYHTCQNCKKSIPIEKLVSRASTLAIGGPPVSNAPTIASIGSGTFIDGTSSTDTIDSSTFALKDYDQLVAVVWSRGGTVADPVSITVSGGSYGLNYWGGQTSGNLRLTVYKSAATTSFGTPQVDYYGDGTDFIRVVWGATFPTCGGVQVFRLSEKVAIDKTTSSVGPGTSATNTTAALGYFDDLLLAAFEVAGPKSSTNTPTWDLTMTSFPIVGPGTGGTNAASCSVAYKRLIDKSPANASLTIPSSAAYAMVSIAFNKA